MSRASLFFRDVPFWLSVMQFRAQLEREFAEKAAKWCENVSDKLYILRQDNVDGNFPTCLHVCCSFFNKSFLLDDIHYQKEVVWGYLY